MRVNKYAGKFLMALFNKKNMVDVICNHKLKFGVKNNCFCKVRNLRIIRLCKYPIDQKAYLEL